MNGIQLLEIINDDEENKFAIEERSESRRFGEYIGDFLKGNVSHFRAGAHRLVSIPVGVLLLEVLLVYLLLADK